MFGFRRFRMLRTFPPPKEKVFLHVFFVPQPQSCRPQHKRYSRFSALMEAVGPAPPGFEFLRYFYTFS